ncbi:hypothetical protein AS359_04205 [Comamonas kerstersii]|uniref:Uncharacterized protein n=1 Tax=Comamonas kerstersii TaxID=225992 RepID=A0A0W7YSJ9_9BURK|nr:hypothetical protein [Comamonas kerstersii]KUF37924.1 hypothetical protein AS359_04205 [Comamonas kerstersii]
MSTNLYKRLLSLLPDEPVQSGTVSLVYSDGTALVTLDGGGGQLRVRNPLGIAAAQKVYVKAGEITGQAPDLPYVLIEV